MQILVGVIIVLVLLATAVIFSAFMFFIYWITDKKRGKKGELEEIYEFVSATEAEMASQFRIDLIEMIRDMIDRTISDQEISELLKICHWADEWYVKTHPGAENSGQTERMLRNFIKG